MSKMCECGSNQIGTRIEFGGKKSLRLFSGFRGSAKTTELFRLQRSLEAQGYFVLYADALDYVNANEPIEITDLLMVLAGAFSGGLGTLNLLNADLARETFWDRLRTFLHLEVAVKEVVVKTEYQTPAKELLGGLKT